jgi:YbbR domain-containing protein
MKKKIHIITASIIFAIILWGSVSLSNDFFASYEIPIKVVNFPQGYTLSTPLPHKISIKVKGQGWKLIGVNLNAEPEYIISSNNDSGRHNINLQNFLSENQWLSSDVEIIDITPDTISFFVERIMSKKVAVEPIIEVEFRPGYSFASNPRIEPDSITIQGPVSSVQKLNSITTEKIALKDLNDFTIQEVSVQHKPGFTFSENNLKLTLDVQKIVDKNFEDITVEVLDVPRDREVLLLPNKVSVGLRGGINILGKANPQDIRLYVNYRDVVLDTLGSIVPKAELPENLRLLYLKPERLRYIIKKFN